MDTYLFIDLSYFIFYLYYARKKYFEFKEKPLDNLIHNEEFLEGFKSFDIKINQIKKKLNLPNTTKIIFGKDCKRKEIWRNKLYPNYKKSRKENNEIGEFFAYAYKNIIEKYIYIENQHCEADDVIGVLTKHLYEKNKIYIITGDHDYLQLLYNENVQIYNMKFKSLREKSCGNNSNDLMLKILIGDSSDNINSIHKKLGPKTAQKYIENNDLLIKKLEDEEIKNNYELNKKLIDMNEIPINYIEEILNKFKKIEYIYT
jgi:5'-3' exonuclease